MLLKKEAFLLAEQEVKSRRGNINHVNFIKVFFDVISILPHRFWAKGLFCFSKSKRIPLGGGLRAWQGV